MIHAKDVISNLSLPAQQRILQQCEHVLDGPLVLAVRGSLESPSSSITSTSTNQSQGVTAPAQVGHAHISSILKKV